MASSFSKWAALARFTGPIVKKLIIKRKDDYMMWIGIALVLIGVFLIGKSS